MHVQGEIAIEGRVELSFVGDLEARSFLTYELLEFHGRILIRFCADIRKQLYHGTAEHVLLFKLMAFCFEKVDDDRSGNVLQLCFNIWI